MSTGQLLPTPSQLSATSHAPAAARHTAVLFPSAGHAAADPVQVSATSHTPAAARRRAPEATSTPGGQLLPTPTQLSATSHAPAAARQTAVLFPSARPAARQPVHHSA